MQNKETLVQLAGNIASGLVAHSLCPSEDLAQKIAKTSIEIAREILKEIDEVTKITNGGWTNYEGEF